MLFLLLCAVGFLHTGEASKILAIMTVPAHSHHIWQVVYLEALAKRGHEITYLNVDEYKNKPSNIRQIFLSNAYDLYGIMNFTDLAEQDAFTSYAMLEEWEDIFARMMIKTEGFKEFLKIIKNEKFDLIIFDVAQALYLLGAIDVLGRPPVLGVTAFSIPPWTFEFTGSPYPVANNPNMFHKLGNPMTFWERLQNAAFFMLTHVFRGKFMAIQEQVSKEVFGKDVRHILDIDDDINLNIVNANWVTDYPFPHAPGFIPIAGIHIKEPKPLPADLKKYLDESPEGVIYFSLGSNIQSAYLQDEQIKELTTAFAQLAPVKVLWKWEKDILPGQPPNVRIGKWLPQTDILNHPNVRLFFTHGGMLSTQEALYYGVPIVGMPIFLDQHVNANKMVLRGLGETINLAKIKADNVVSAIRKVLTNPRYKQNAKEASAIFRDQQNRPLDQIIYWTEYAIRHKGASHLRPTSKSLSWFQSGLYDLILFVGLVILALVILTYKMLSKFFRTLSALVLPSKTKRE